MRALVALILCVGCQANSQEAKSQETVVSASAEVIDGACVIVIDRERYVLPKDGTKFIETVGKRYASVAKSPSTRAEIVGNGELSYRCIGGTISIFQSAGFLKTGVMADGPSRSR